MAESSKVESPLQDKVARASDRKTQRARILRLLIDARSSWVPLHEILALGIAQFGARIFEMRRMGFLIENRIKRDDSGAVHSWYRLVNSPAPAESQAVATPASSPVTSSSSADWYERQSGQKRAPLKPRDELPLFDSLLSEVNKS
jgi:Helix-turn-helix domain